MASSSTSERTESKMIILLSSDNVLFEVEEKVIAQSKTIQHVIEDDYNQEEIPISNVAGPILAKVIEYCRKHVEYSDNDDEELKKWDAEFLQVDQATLFEITVAANYLDIKSLLDHCCQTIADIAKCMSSEEIAEYFNVTCDFSPEELEELKKKEKDSSWNEIEASN